MARSFAINAATTNQQYPTNGVGGVTTTAASGMAKGRTIVHAVYNTLNTAAATNIELTKGDGTSYSPALQFGTTSTLAALASYTDLEIELPNGMGMKNSVAGTGWLVVFSVIGGG